MDFNNKPMESLIQWQEWYRNNINPTTTVTPMADCYAFSPEDKASFKKKAVEYFSDTLCEFTNELTGAELFDCFKLAVEKTYNTQKQELDNTKQLFDLVHGKSCQENCAKSKEI